MKTTTKTQPEITFKDGYSLIFNLWICLNLLWFCFLAILHVFEIEKYVKWMMSTDFDELAAVVADFFAYVASWQFTIFSLCCLLSGIIETIRFSNRLKVIAAEHNVAIDKINKDHRAALGRIEEDFKNHADEILRQLQQGETGPNLRRSPRSTNKKNYVY